MFEYTCKLESLLRYKDKDIDRLSYLNQYLTEAQKKRDEIILESQKEIQRLKQLVILYQKKVSEASKKEYKELTNMSVQDLVQDLDTTLSNTLKQSQNNLKAIKAPTSRPQTERMLDQISKGKSHLEGKMSNLKSKRQPDIKIQNAKLKPQPESKIPQNRQVKLLGNIS